MSDDDNCCFKYVIPLTYFDTPDAYGQTSDNKSYDLYGMAHQYILGKLMANYDPQKPDPVRQYLLQHAYWIQIDQTMCPFSPDDDAVTYGAFSDMMDQTGNWWALYDLDISIRAVGDDDDKTLSISSWKGDYDTDDDYDPPQGSLRYDGPRHDFVGTIWTRGIY